MKSRIFVRRLIGLSRFVFIFAAVLFVASCASIDNWGTTDPPIIKVNVVSYLAITSVGLPTTIYFSVVNVTDEPVTNLTLDVSVNPPRGVDVPFHQVVIDRIEPRGSWKPEKPFSVRGRIAGTTSVYFIVKKDGEFMAKNCSLVTVQGGTDYTRPHR